MANEEKSKGSWSIAQIVGIVGVIGALSSLGNFGLNLLDLGEGSVSQLTWLQLLPFGTFLFAFLLACIDYEMKRDKWPGRLKELARSVVAISVIGPEDAGPRICRTVVEVIKVYHRMALAEGKNELAKDLKADLDRWQKGTTQEMFHFHDSKHVDELLRETKTRLDIKGDISLSRLVHQITDYNRSMVKRGMNTDLHYNSSYLKGSTLSLLLDSCGIAIQELEDEISCIGRIDRRLIRNPKFSKDSSEIDKAFARLFGAGLSDGHIDQFHVFCYGDADVDRVRIFKKHVEFFGNVEYTETISKRGFHDVRYSSVLGRMLEKRGFTAGDKTVQNGGIPDFILNGPEEVFVEYPKQLWAEDGEFSSTSASHKAFRWTRSMALIDPEKDLKYGIDRAFSQEITSFMQAHGTYTEECSFPDRESYPRYVLTKTDIDRLKQDKDIAISNTATWLSSFIESNKPLLMKHEISLLDRIGISTRDSYDDITYYIETGRVSVLFRASTVSLYDAMKVAVIAAPDDKQKRLRVIEWIQSNYALYKQACHEMMMRGYQISLDVNDNP